MVVLVSGGEGASRLKLTVRLLVTEDGIGVDVPELPV